MIRHNKLAFTLIELLVVKDKGDKGDRHLF